MEKQNRATIVIISLVITLGALAGVFSCASGELAREDVRATTSEGQTPEIYKGALDGKADTEKKEMAWGDSDEILAAPKSKDGGEEGDTTTALEAAQRLSTSEDTRVRSPEMLARLDKPDLEALPFVAHDISVVITGHRARVVYDMVFENPSNRQISGTLMIELPQGASPCYLGMFQGQGPAQDPQSLPSLLSPAPPQVEKLLDREIRLDNTWQAKQNIVDWGELRPARVVSPVQGREVYETVTRRRVDPALAEWAGGNKFSTRIFPIPPKGYKRVIFAYDRPLAFSNGSFLFPLPVPAEMRAQTRVFVHLVSADGAGGKLISGESELASTSAAYGSFWRMNLDKTFKGNIIFTGRATQPDLSVLVGSDAEISGKLIHLLYKPEITAQVTPALTGRAVILLDTSLSAKDKLYQRSGALLKNILESDSSLTEYAIVAFDVRARSFTNGFVKNTSQNRGTLLHALEGLWLEGATNFTDALLLVANDPALAQADTIFLLSDGIITWGTETLDEIKIGFASLLEKRWICYSFGDENVNRGLFTLLTRYSGRTVHVGVEQDLASATKAHRTIPATLNQIAAMNQEELAVSGSPRLLYPGQVLEIACRSRTAQDQFYFVITVDGVTRTVAVPLHENPLTTHLAARSWAELYANRLLDLYDKKANEIVLALSQRFALSNREASFLILETDVEYVQYKVNAAELDLGELARIAREKKTRFPFGAPDTDALSPEQLAFIDLLLSNAKKEASVSIPWDIKTSPALGGDAFVLASPPTLKRPKESTAELYIWARQIAKSAGDKDQKKMEQALRALSSIVELRPQEDAALRLVGYVLLEWSLYREACDLFTRVRQRRPFEPQNYILEGMSLAAQGKYADAALRYEIVLTRDFTRFDEYTRPVTEVLYTQLLEEMIKTKRDQSVVAAAKKRLATLDKTGSPKGRIFLFWNLDDTDVDLHVLEPGGEEVSYEHRDSKSGGKLYWDNTTGLGPEMFTHPLLDQRGFNVFVKYFGSSSVEGAAPSATLVCAFTRRAQGKPVELRFYTTVLVGTQEDKVEIMPLWKP